MYPSAAKCILNTLNFAPWLYHMFHRLIKFFLFFILFQLNLDQKPKAEQFKGGNKQINIFLLISFQKKIKTKHLKKEINLVVLKTSKLL